jgi:hypothetical protein
MRAIDGRSVFRRSDDVVCRQVGAESILVPVRNHTGKLDFIYTLSAVAARIWQLLDGARPVDAVVDVICEEFDVDRDTATADLAALVSDLAEVSLITQET